LRAEQERNKMLQEDMEATLQDIQNIWTGSRKGKVQGHLGWTRSDFCWDVRLLRTLPATTTTKTILFFPKKSLHFSYLYLEIHPQNPSISWTPKPPAPS
jgi:hypothetical protein